MGTTEEARYEEALELLEEGDADAALAHARALADAGDLRGFELQAIALAELGRTADAVAILEGATAAHPQNWLLWQLLGNALSDLDQHDRAVPAYDRALSLPGVDRDSVEYNRALSRARAGDHDGALAGLTRLAAGPFAVRAGALRVAVLRERGLIDEALLAAEETRSLVGRDTEEIGGEGELLAELAETLLRGKGDRAGAERAARESLADEAHPLAFEVLRELRGETSPKARWQRLTVEGRLPQGHGEPVGFYRVYEVVADDADVALRLAADIEPAECRASLRLQDHEAGEPAPGELVGVVSASEYLCFDEVRE